jgi:uncharacterized protein (UPF0128 family)
MQILPNKYACKSVHQKRRRSFLEKEMRKWPYEQIMIKIKKTYFTSETYVN